MKNQVLEGIILGITFLWKKDKTINLKYHKTHHIHKPASHSGYCTGLLIRCPKMGTILKTAREYNKLKISQNTSYSYAAIA